MTTSIENVEVKQSSEGNQVEVTTTMTPNHKNLKKNEKDFRPKISVVGVGGAGCNAVNNMIRSQLEGVEFIVMNTDAQALQQSLAERRVHLGDELTQGLGAGSSPDVGHAAAEESHEQIAKEIRGSNMVFIAAGMGGGTGTGSAPVIARTARDLGILTVGVVTKPFNFEGAHRMRTAERGIEELQKAVDTLIVIPNQNLFRVANENTTFADAFKMADDVLYAGVRSITDLMIMPGLINLDFADVRTVMSEMGKAMMGTGEADGEGRAIAAAAAAIANPLLDDVSMRGAKGVLISITGGMDMTLFEVDEAANRIREEVEVDANIIFGSTFDDRLNGRVRVSVVATGMQSGIQQKSAAPRPQEQASTQQPQPEGLFSSPASTPAQNNQNKTLEKPAERPLLNLGSDELENREEDLMRDITLASPASSSEDFLDATNERAPHPMPNIFEKMSEADEPLPPFLEQPETARENNQMEIQFASPAVNKKPSQPERPQPPKESVSAGNFLSRFLRGRNKNPAPVTPPKEIPTFKTSQSLNPHKDSPNTFEDELDVPTFMRKQGSER